MGSDYPQGETESQSRASPQDVVPGTPAAERVAAALKACAENASHKGQWIEEQADTLGYGHERFRNWYYGRFAPDTLDDFNRLIAHFGTRFLSAYLEPLGLIAVNARDTQTLNIVEINRWLRTAPQQLEGLAADMRELKERVVPVGKAS